MNTEAWRRRPMTVTVFDRCDECETLQENVRKRSNYWPNVTMHSCQRCFDKALAEFYNLSST